MSGDGQQARRRGRAALGSERKELRVDLTGRERVMPDGATLVTTTDLTGKILYGNRDFLEISHARLEDVRGKAHSIIRHPDMPRSAFLDLWQTLQAGRPWNGIVKNRSLNGDHYYVDANVAPRVENGQTTGYISVRRKPSREKIAAAEALYKDIREGRRTFPWSSMGGVSIAGKSRLLILVTLLSVIGLVAADAASAPPFVRWLLLALVVGSSIASGVLFRSVLGPLAEATAVANRIASGDLRAAIPHRREDELGALQQALLKMLINNAAVIAQIKESSAELSEGAAGVATASASLAGGADETSHQATTIASSSQEMSQSLLVISSSAEEMSASIGEVARKAAEAARVASDASHAARQTDEVVRELGARAAAIGRVVDTIANIASQTNLLALNASIEAAAAGDAGRGFAVVASEVKELARQTAGASEEVQQMIRAVQASAGTAVDAIRRISEVNGQSDRITSAIAAAVEEQSATTRGIASSVSELSAAAEDVARSIERISGTAASGATDAQRGSAAAAKLTSLAGDLAQLTKQFVV